MKQTCNNLELTSAPYICLRNGQTGYSWGSNMLKSNVEFASLLIYSWSNLVELQELTKHFVFPPGQFQLTGPPRPIVATLGDDIILPCHLVPGTDVAGKTLEWTRPELDPRYVFVWRAGQDHVNLKNPSYKGRTSLYTGELQHGNISLKLSNVKPSDGGRYKCYVPDLNTESFVELVVGM